MKPIFILAAVIALAACGLPDYYNAPQNYVCTAEQMAKAEREAKAAAELTKEERSVWYWYTSAIMRNCKRREQ